MSNATYLLFGHDSRVLPVQVALVRKHLAPDRIVVVQGPVGDPGSSGGNVWLTDEAAAELGVETMAVPQHVAGKTWITRRYLIQEQIVDAIGDQEEEHAWVLEGDVLPVRDLNATAILDGHTIARRVGPNIGTWFCFDASNAKHPYQHPDPKYWPAYGCTREHWPDGLPMPKDYADEDHFEWCEPGFLHLDRIANGLPEKKLMMLQEILPERKADSLPVYSLSEKFTNWRESVKRWRAAGKPVRSSREVKRIVRQYCEPCEHYNPKWKQCNLCGCFCRDKGRAVFNKPKMKTERCPLNPPKWGGEDVVITTKEEQSTSDNREGKRRRRRRRRRQKEAKSMPERSEHCVYFGEELSKGMNACLRFERCRRTEKKRDAACCEDCKERLPLNHPQFTDRWVDHLPIVDRTENPTYALRDLLAERSVFLVCGGPSSKRLPLERLNERGVWSMGVNNGAGHPRFRANAFVCSDPPMKFSHSIWLDPAVMKFVPSPKMKGNRAKLRRKDAGVFSKMKRGVTECPNVWGFQRLSWMIPNEEFFLADGSCWGNLNAGVKMTGEAKTVCTMLLGMRLLRHLGAKRVYLVGVDFSMRPGEVYSFDQDKNPGGCESNNTQFSVVNSWLCRMQESGVFTKFGIEFYNCNPTSGLRAFPHVPFEVALADVTSGVEQEPDLRHWYEKASCEKCSSWHVDCNHESWRCLDCGHTWRPKT